MRVGFAAVLIFGAALAGCLLWFIYIAGMPTLWQTSTFAELGTFLGGVFGPAALVLAILQYAAAEKASRKSNAIALEERHRADLRQSIERKTARLDATLDNAGWLKVGDRAVTLRMMLGTAVSYLPEYQIPDFSELSKQVKSDPDGKLFASNVLLLEACAHVGLQINQLRSLCIEFDKISGSNVMSLDIRSSYVFIIQALHRKNYPVEAWD